MLTSKTKTIDGLKLRVDILELEAAEECFARAMRAVGPMLGTLARAATSGGLKNTSEGELAAAATQLTASLTKDEIEFFRSTFAAVTFHQVGAAWVKMVPGVVFKGRLATMFKWLWFAIETNFADFLSVALAMSPQSPGQGDPTPSASDSPTG